MIAKGTTHNNGAKLATYLITGKGNERATLFQLRGFASNDIREAFRSVHVMAEATRAEQPFFHVQVRTPDEENLTPQQWERVADRIESKLGLTGQPRAIAFHTSADTGHAHMHIAWSRIDDETMTARALPFYKLRLKEVCRELEIELGLIRVTNERGGPSLSPTRAEFEQARRLGIDIHSIRTTIRECWDHSDNGRSFLAALAEKDLTLARGTQRDFLVIDRAGGIHSLGKRILGHSAAEVRARLSDLKDLPGLEQVRTQLGCPVRTPELDRVALLSAIEGRDAGAVLECVTKHRATFTARDLEQTLSPGIENASERSGFVKEILSHAETVHLTGRGSASRYTTDAVLFRESEVLNAAGELHAHRHHDVALAARIAVLNQPKYASISREQVRALRHATGPEGFALIDGQAGTGKSYVMGAIRESYEKKGRRVIGLAPTNVVVRSMKEDGFVHAETLHSELYALDRGRARWDDRTVILLDEAAMVDTRNLGRLTARAKSARAKVILVGDDRQLSSVEYGGLFPVLRNLYGAAELSEVRRQQRGDDRRASELMAKGKFREALASHEKIGGIIWAATQSGAADALIKKWTQDHAAEPSKARFIFAYTNHHVDELNHAVRAARLERGELGPSTRLDTRHGGVDFAEGDRIQFSGTDKRLGIYNGHVGTVQNIDGSIVRVLLDGKRKRIVEFDARRFQDFRHGYAGTIYKGQGKTIDQTYLFHSEYWRSASSYVALTRHSHQTQLFVARDTTSDLAELARQMSRLDDRRAASHYLKPDSEHRRRTRRLNHGIDWHRHLNDAEWHQPSAHSGRQLRTDLDRGGGLER